MQIQPKVGPEDCQHPGVEGRAELLLYCPPVSSPLKDHPFMMPRRRC